MAHGCGRLSACASRISSTTELRWRALVFACLVFGSLMIATGEHESTQAATNWYVLYVYSGLLILTAQMSDTATAFFLGRGDSVWTQLRYIFLGSAAPRRDEALVEPLARGEVGFWTLMPSAFITWIFAKSIQNAAVLGGYFGVLGGVGYAGWYTSFASAAAVGYVLRTRHGFTSLPRAVERCYGPWASGCFSLALLFRLWNEVWSNASVVASFYGEVHSTNWWIAVALSTAVPATYVVMGGMRASLVSDQLQALLGVTMLFSILGLIGDDMPGGLGEVWSFSPPGGWLDGGGTLLGAALIQGLTSYPFHDPVLTDRAFLSRPRTMVAAFFVGGAIAATFIILFSAVGIYGCYVAGAVKNGAPVDVARSLSSAAFTFINLVMMTSSLSTLDSTFTSCAKLCALELFGWLRLEKDARPAGKRGPLAPADASVTSAHIALGRASILSLALAGALNLLADTEALSATTVSGTMVMGLGPPVLLLLAWRFGAPDGSVSGWRQAPLAFLFSFVPGIVFGALYSVATAKRYFTDEDGAAASEYRYEALRESLIDRLAMGTGPYSLLLGMNVIGHCTCFGGCAVGFAVHALVWKLPRTVGEPTVEDPKTGERRPRPGHKQGGDAEEAEPAQAVGL